MKIFILQRKFANLSVSMKSIMASMLVIVVLFSMLPSCKMFKKGTSSSSTDSTSSNPSGSASHRWNSPETPLTGNIGDTIIVSGSEYLPMYGRSKDGILPALEGTWELESMNGTNIPEHSNFIKDITTKIERDNQIANAKILQGALGGSMELRRDSITKKTKQGTQTTTTVYIIDNTPVPRITQPQGSDYHVPDKPSIRFYGSNETFSGFTGCNKFAGRYVLSDTNSISLKTASPSTRTPCLGDYNEDEFINNLHRVTNFKGENGKLELMEGSTVVLVFNKKTDEP